MPAGPIQITGSTGQRPRMADVTSGGRLRVDVGEGTPPNDSSINNPAWQFVYMTSGTATGIDIGSAIGSIIQTIGTGSFIQVITYANNNVTNVGSWV